MSINTNTNMATGAGGGAGADDAGAGASFSPYRTRGVIDANLNRLPTASDVSVAFAEPLVPGDAFIVTSSGTPFAGVTGATAVNPGDYLVYASGTVTVGASWCAVPNPDYTAGLPNCPPRFVRVVGQRGADDAAA